MIFIIILCAVIFAFVIAGIVHYEKSDGYKKRYLNGRSDNLTVIKEMTEDDKTAINELIKKYNKL